MKIKMFDIFDGTYHIPALAIKADGDTVKETKLFDACGFSKNVVILILPEQARSNFDPFAWGSSSFGDAHRYIRAHFDELQTCSLIDVSPSHVSLSSPPDKTQIWKK